jgi:hypothetical protein
MTSLADQLTATERLDEIAEILSVGLMRLRTRQSSPLSRDCGESSLHSSPDQSGHPNPENRRLSDG